MKDMNVALSVIGGMVLLLGVLLNRLPDILFLGWFGPIGVSAIFYAMLAMHRTGNDAAWTIGSLVICASIIAHGMTATPLTQYYGRKEMS